MTRHFYLWQQALSPHLGGLTAHLAEHGIASTLVHHRALSPDRAAMGWKELRPDGVEVVHAPDAAAVARLVAAAPAGAIHSVEGIARNGLNGLATRLLARRAARIWPRLETLDDDGWKGALRRLDYRWRLARLGTSVERYLAIGGNTPAWLVARGVPRERISAFTYFLPPGKGEPIDPPPGPLRLLFVGQLVALKRVEDLIDAVARLPEGTASLTIVGDGPDRRALEERATACARHPVRFAGTVAMDQIRGIIRDHDVLVLPSRKDGWGAVASEALIEGSRVLCSDHCGAAAVVEASGAGRVFPRYDVPALAEALAAMAARGRVTGRERSATARWARCLTAPVGAAYLARLWDDPTACPPWQEAAR